MAFKHGRLGEITVNTKALTLYLDTFDLDIQADTADTSVFTNAWHTYIVGLLGGSVTFSGDYDPTVTTGAPSVLTLSLGTIIPIIVYPAGNNAGQGTSHTVSAILTNYKESSKTTDKVSISGTLLFTGVDTIAQL